MAATREISVYGNAIMDSFISAYEGWDNTTGEGSTRRGMGAGKGPDVRGDVRLAGATVLSPVLWGEDSLMRKTTRLAAASGTFAITTVLSVAAAGLAGAAAYPVPATVAGTSATSAAPAAPAMTSSAPALVGRPAAPAKAPPPVTSKAAPAGRAPSGVAAPALTPPSTGTTTLTGTGAGTPVTFAVSTGNLSITVPDGSLTPSTSAPVLQVILLPPISGP